MTREEALFKIEEAIDMLTIEKARQFGQGPAVCLTVEYRDALAVLSRPCIEIEEGWEVVSNEIVTGEYDCEPYEYRKVLLRRKA